MKVKAFPFLADPPVGETYVGIEEFPGFHTASDFDIAATYAVGRVSQSFEFEGEDGKHYVTDYPVVVGLNMSGRERTTDYDAERIVKDVLEVHLEELINELSKNPTNEEIYNAMENMLNTAEYQSDLGMYNSVLDFIGEDAFMHFNNPLWALFDNENAVDIVREYIQDKTIPKEVLMEATQQYRYLTDVDEENIISVAYISPIADVDAMIDPFSDEFEQLEEAWEGFSLLSIDDIDSGTIPYEISTVWENPNSRETARVEYHGTTYERLLSAAPHLKEILPQPPTPPYVPGE